MRLDGITEVLAIKGFVAAGLDIGEHRIDVRLDRDGCGFRCARCGQVHLVPHDTHEVTVQDLPMTGRNVYLHFDKARVRCCGRHPELEHLPWVEKNGQQTVRLKWSIYQECKASPVKAVAERHRLSWDTVKSIDRELIEHRLAKRNLKGIKQLGIDEVAMAKRHRYLTVVSDLRARKVIWVGEGRKSRSLARFFKALPETTRRRIEVVAIDMWKAYRKSVEKWLPNAEVVFDKFHVVAHLGKALDEVRKNEARRLDKDDRKILKRKRWVLLKGAENLTPTQQGTLKDLMDANKNLQKAYLLKEEFRDFYRTDFKWHWQRGLFKRIAELARNALRGWVKRAKESLRGALREVLPDGRTTRGGYTAIFREACHQRPQRRNEQQDQGYQAARLRLSRPRILHPEDIPGVRKDLIRITKTSEEPNFGRAENRRRAMPIYEYRCRECGEVTEALVRMGGKPDLACSKCGSKNLKRKFSTFASHGGSSGGSSAGSCPTGTCPLS